MNTPAATIGRHAGPRRGVLALSLAMGLMMIVFALTLSFTLGLVVQSLRVENAEAATQALYAAEAGLDVALQTGSRRPLVGECGRSRYAATMRGGQVIALGQVELASGTQVRRAIMIRRARGGIVRGSWRLVPPARQTELVEALEQEEAAGP